MKLAQALEAYRTKHKLRMNALAREIQNYRNDGVKISEMNLRSFLKEGKPIETAKVMKILAWLTHPSEQDNKVEEWEL